MAVGQAIGPNWDPLAPIAPGRYAKRRDLHVSMNAAPLSSSAILSTCNLDQCTRIEDPRTGPQDAIRKVPPADVTPSKNRSPRLFEQYHGSEAGRQSGAPIVGIASTPSGGGYWEVASNGAVYSFGDAAYRGGESAKHMDAPIVGGRVSGCAICRNRVDRNG